MEKFGKYDLGQIIQLIVEARLTWDFQRSGDVDYLREFASKHFFPVGETEDISSIHIKREHNKYKQATSNLLEICPQLFTILKCWCAENEQYNSMITDEMKKDRDTRYNNVIEKLQQQECTVMVFGDTGAGKSSLINMILEQDLMRTSPIKTTFTVCEIRYSTTNKYSIAQTEISEFIEQPYPSSGKDTITTCDRHQLDYVRERYECPIDLLEGGIIIADSPGLNENDTLTKFVQAYMKDCLVFICVINCGITDSLQNLLNELKSAGRTSAKSIFFVVTHLDDKDLIDQQQALNDIHSELGKLYEDYDPMNNCCMINPDKAFKTYSKHHIYEQAHYEFLKKFIPFLSNALKIKLEYLFDDLYDIYERLDETIHIKHNQSIMELQQCLEITQRIIIKKEKFDEAKDRIKSKTKHFTNSFEKEIIQKMLNKCNNREFKDELEQAAIQLKLPLENQKELKIGEFQFIKKENEWRVQLTNDEAIKLLKRYALSLKSAKTFLGQMTSNVNISKSEYSISSVELYKIYCQNYLSKFIQKNMALVLDEETKKVTEKIWKECQDDLQAIDDEIMNAYQQLTDLRNERYDTIRIRRRQKTLLQQMTDNGSTLDFFTRTKLWFITYTFEMPLHIEALIDWFKGMTYKEMTENENTFKLKVTQYFRLRIVEKLEKQINNLEKTAKDNSKRGAFASSSNRTTESTGTIDSDTIVDSVLNVFEQVYTEIQQLSQILQTETDAQNLKEMCITYMKKLELTKHLLNNFRADHLLVWPLKSNEIIYETNNSQLSSYDGCYIYNGQLIIDTVSSIPVHIRQLTNEFNVLDIHNQCETLIITNNYQHILHCYGVYNEDSKLFVVTEPIHSKLETFLSDTIGASLNTEERIQLALEIAQCIQYLHREKVYYNYIHPNSIMITSDQHIKLNVVGEKNDFLYMSPERLHRRLDIPLSYDNIYAFGLVLYRLFHTDTNEIEIFRSGKWLLQSVENIDTIDVLKTYYIDYIYKNHSSMKFHIPKINPNINDMIKKLIRACCNNDAQQRPDINAIITILSTEKLHVTNPISLPLQNNAIKQYGLLSIDGGGSRGIIAAKIMEILESKIGKPLWTVFDLVGGSSTGGMLVLSSLQRRTRADQLAELYKKLSSKIFPFSRVLPTTQYSHEPLEEEFKDHFEELKLTATDTSPKLFVVTKRSTDTQPYLLRNYNVTPTDNNLFYQGCSGWLCRDAARATTAAPTYFKPFIQNGIEYSDGGVGFNNPIQLVFEEALSLSTTTDIGQLDSTKTLYHFPISYIVSIGTGLMPSLPHGSLSQKFGWSGLIRIKNATDILLEQATECENAHRAMNIACERYGIPYFRFNTPLPERIRMDLGDETNLNRLIDLTNEYMNTESVKTNIEKLCQLIKDK